MREEILKLRESGATYTEIVQKLNVTKSIVAYYCNEKRFDKEKFKKKEESKLEYENIIVNHIKNSDNINQICKKLNIRPSNTNYTKINKIIDKYNVNIDHFCVDFTKKENNIYTLETIFCKNSLYTSYSNLKDKLINNNLKEYKCECCNGTEWLNKPIPLQTHHVDGVKTNNEISNLQLLCPNCHTFTDNYTGKNIKTILPSINVSKNIRIECGILTSNNKFCSKKCQLDYNLKQLPSKDDIIEKFKLFKSFTQVSKQYNISDRGLVKWCTRLELPTIRKEMD